MKFLNADSNKVISELLIDKIPEGPELSNNIVRYPQVNRTYNYSRIYISQINKVCPREEAIGTLLKLKKSVKLFHANVHMMNFGSAFHYWVQNNPDMFFEKDMFLGYWRCTACNRQLRFGVKPKHECPHCGALPGHQCTRNMHLD